MSENDILFLQGCEKTHRRLLDRFQDEIVSVDRERLQKILVEELASDEYHIYNDYFNQNRQKCLEKFMKSNEKSSAKRSEANTLLCKKIHSEQMHEHMWKLYSKSIALASTDSEESAFGYGNRSFLMLHLKKYEESIKDIDRSVSITKSDSLKVKLLCRKMTCLASIGGKEVEKMKTW